MSGDGSIAVVGFVPDRGHVQPLLRLAAALTEDSERTTTCVLPEEFEGLVRGFGFGWHPLPIRARTDTAKLFADLSRKSLFQNAFSNYGRLRHDYWAPLMADAAGLLPDALAFLQSLDPDLVMCDPQLFKSWYAGMARCCRARLLIHQTLAPLTRPHSAYERAFGLSSLPAWRQRLVLAAGRANRSLARYLGAALHPGKTLYSRALARDSKRRAFEILDRCGGDPAEQTVIHTGVGALEHLDLADGAPAPGDTRFVLYPAGRSGHGEVPEDLARWIAAQAPRPVIYACWGTMVRLHRRIAEMMLKGFLEAGVSVVWVLPGEQADLLGDAGDLDHVRIERFLPQAEVLALDAIRAFVGCGGSGSIMEAVSSGKPVLSIPFLWDQAYNASVAVRLGVGLSLEKRGLTSALLAQAVCRLISEPALAREARAISMVLRDPPPRTPP